MDGFDYEQVYSIMNALVDGRKDGLRVIDLGSNQLELENAMNIMDILENTKINKEALMNLKEVNFVGNYINYSK